MRRQRGLTLPEIIIFIVIMGIALAGMFALFSQFTRQSPDPLVRKQALSIAQALMEEIQLQAFTYCDPDDVDVYTATSTAGCAATAPNDVEALGPETGEGRYGAGPNKFDNVNDYNTFSMTTGNIRDITNSPIAGLDSYSVDPVVVATMTGDLPGMITNDDALLITVTVRGPLGVSATLQGYRLRYAPNSP